MVWITFSIQTSCSIPLAKGFHQILHSLCLLISCFKQSLLALHSILITPSSSPGCLLSIQIHWRMHPGGLWFVWMMTDNELCFPCGFLLLICNKNIVISGNYALILKKIIIMVFTINHFSAKRYCHDQHIFLFYIFHTFRPVYLKLKVLLGAICIFHWIPADILPIHLWYRAHDFMLASFSVIARNKAVHWNDLQWWKAEHTSMSQCQKDVTPVR